MLLAVDVGNTNISFGIFKGGKLGKRFDIPAKNYRLKKLKQGLARVKADNAAICSVVPDITRILATDLKRYLGSPASIIGKEIKVPIKNLYRRPKQVGQDRLVNAYAGVRLYGAPLIVVDFGTAVTFDVVSKNKEYLGGVILPGLQISLDALKARTALLPKVNLALPGELIGRDTKNSMLSGIIYGFSALVDALSEKIKREIGKNARVIATGGNSGLIAGYCRKIDKIDNDLTLKGINLIYEGC
ncbi:MAG: type III pantothenate kinase [Candidatus Omnitrophota bacterium]|jgi:type III pantothenate kinase